LIEATIGDEWRQEGESVGPVEEVLNELTVL